jgi:serpin B
VTSLVILAGLLTGCGPTERVTAQLTPGDARAVSAEVDAFGFALLGQVTDGEQNVVISPVSASALLRMVLAGADGETAAAMAKVLHAEGARDPRIGVLLADLADTDEVTLTVGNAIWGDTSTDFLDDYQAYVERTYDATVGEAELGNQRAANEIDEWVRERTRGRIPEIARDLELPSPNAVAVLLNAVYFLGDCQHPFDVALTREEPFTLPDGGEVRVPIMHRSVAEFDYANRNGYAVLRLPYGESGRYGMTVWLPDEGSDLRSLLKRLGPTERQSAMRALEPTELVDVGLPRFELEWKAELKRPLTELGMGVAFGPGADFSRMSQRAAYLSTVVQKTFMKVDEKGTEAAAVTGG